MTPIAATAVLERPEAPIKKIRRVSVLGATGSVGKSALSVIGDASGRFEVAALTAMDNVDQLIADAKKFRPGFVAIGNEEHYARLKEALAGTDIETGAGEQALVEAARFPSDMVVSAIVGAAGLRPTLAAIERGAIIALANKECLIAAGALMKEAVKRCGARLLPVDSEHSAVYQTFTRTHPEWVEKVTLTASGGPFRTWSREQMEKATPEQALRHPNWSMGAKISIDSATLMNKGLELIEAYHLFPLTPDQLDVLVHPESIVHSLVAYRDGAVLAQLSAADMRAPLAYALAWPERMETRIPRLDLAKLGQLTFEAPDVERFPALSLARSALREGAASCIALSAANEMAVAAFLARRIGFLDIVSVVAEVLEHEAAPIRTLGDVFEADRAARERAEDAISHVER